MECVGTVVNTQMKGVQVRGPLSLSATLLISIGSDPEIHGMQLICDPFQAQVHPALSIPDSRS